MRLAQAVLARYRRAELACARAPDFVGAPVARYRRAELALARSEQGLSLVELLLALAISAVLIAALGGVVGPTLNAWELAQRDNQLTREARFAVDRMTAAVRGTTHLLVPRADDPNTAYSESLRDVLALALDPTLDRDGNGFADADNDQDGRINEDWGFDNNDDGEPGIAGIDDDGDGATDEGSQDDNDEDGMLVEDPLDGLDNDGDAAIDEDVPADMNGDSQPGLAGVDDDGDTFTDEGNPEDDDEDGTVDEDWLDTVVYFLSGTTLMERLPDVGASSGTDFSTAPIAENVNQFEVERLLPAAGQRAVLVRIRLELATPEGASILLESRVRVGSTQ